jgi:sulfite exporter TauE/SafE
MWILISAIVTASLLGSLHCVGMCGPLAIWASGAGDGRSKSQMALATSLYHFGRLLTYALAGLLAGAIGQLADVGGEALGIQLLAARIVGGLMIALGAIRLVQLLWKPRGGLSGGVPSPQPSIITRLLLRLRPYVFHLPIPARGLATGLLTPLLPCGWLYLFALVTAGTGSLMMGPVVMVAFWIGTVPALVGLVSSAQFLAVRFRRTVPAAAAVLLIVGGCYTAAGRGFAGLNSLADIAPQSDVDFANVTNIDPLTDTRTIEEDLQQLTATKLPCCAEHSTLTDTPSNSDAVIPSKGPSE